MPRQSRDNPGIIPGQNSLKIVFMRFLFIGSLALLEIVANLEVSGKTR